MTSALADIIWREPAWLWVAAWPWFWLFIRKYLGRYDRTYAETALWPWARAQQGGIPRGWRYWREACVVTGWLLLAGAMAGPRLPQAVYGQDRSRLPELMVVIDVSHSMSATDMMPTRLERARLELFDLVRYIDRWRVGLVLYAANPHLLVPPSDDKSLLRHYLQIPRTGLLPIEGSDPLSALEFAARIENDPDNYRSLLLITDGESSQQDSTYQQKLRNLVTTLRQSGTKLYVLGVGSENGSTLTDPDGGWLAKDGQTIVSRLQEQRLQALAETGGGRYITARKDNSDWQYLYTDGFARQYATAKFTGKEDNGRVIWQELYLWLLVPGIALLFIAHLRRPRRDIPAAYSQILVLLLGVQLVLPSHNVKAESPHSGQTGWQAYTQGDYQLAQELYRQIPGFAGRMGEGSSSYLREDYRTAVQQFTRAVLIANTDSQRADALFNLANCYVRLQRYSDAVAVYDDVLVYRSNDSSAEHNRKLARKLARQQQRNNIDERGRQGSGPRTRELRQGEDLARGNLTLGDAADNTEEYSLQGENSRSASPLTRNDRVSLADEDIIDIKDREWTYDISSVEQLDARATYQQNDPSALWQRLFEVEAGYPAPLKQPHRQAGVSPW
ncbi:MAG: VWA domain-containing protein [Thiohalophilus sp.]|jgi:Ca-activated chloride channel family protein